MEYKFRDNINGTSTVRTSFMLAPNGESMKGAVNGKTIDIRKNEIIINAVKSNPNKD